MRTTFRILYPTVVNNNICGETLNNISNTATIRIYNVLGDIVPLQSLSTLQSTPTSGNVLLQDGRMANLGVSYDGTNILLSSDIKNIWDFFSITIEINLVNYISYIKTFKIYGYDLGYTTNLINNYPFDIVLVRDNYTTLPSILHLNYSSFIAYRVPFSNKIYIEKTNSSQVDRTYYRNYTTGEILLETDSGYICYEDEIIIEQVSILNGTICTSNQTVSKFIYKPNYQLETSCLGTCNDECKFNTLDNNEALLNIDFSIISHILVDNIELPISKDFELDFEQYYYDGSLIDSQKQSFNLADTTGTFYIYDSNNYKFNFATPTEGDYLIVGKVKVLGSYLEIIKSGTLTSGKEYIISGADNITDFTVCGSSDNSIGRRFIANTTAPIYGIYGSLIPIYGATYIMENEVAYRIGRLTLAGDYSVCSTPNNVNLTDICFISNGIAPISYGSSPYSYLYKTGYILECRTSSIIQSCNFYNIDRINCNTFQVNNLSTEDITVSIFQLNNLGVFEDTGVSFIVEALNNKILTQSTDGIYYYSITRNNITYTYYLIVMCNVETCMLNRVKLLNCNADKQCIDKDWYEFNAIVSEFYILINLVNNTNIFNNIYLGINTDILTDLFTINQILSRLTYYCSSCNEPCDCGD